MSKSPVVILFAQLAECASHFGDNEAEAAASLLLACFATKNKHGPVECALLLDESFRVIRETIK